MAEPTLTCVQPFAFKIIEQSADVLQSVVIRRVHRSAVAEEEVLSGQQIEHVDLARAKTVVVVAHEDVLLFGDKRDVLVGVVCVGVALLQPPRDESNGRTKPFA